MTPTAHVLDTFRLRDGSQVMLVRTTTDTIEWRHVDGDCETPLGGEFAIDLVNREMAR